MATERRAMGAAVVVLVPAAEPAAAELRLVHDPLAARGVPAHVTILHPFRSKRDVATTDEARRIAAATPAFDATFRDVRRFASAVVYLAPDPASPFATLTARFAQRFPDCPPYGGTIAEPIPHLTVAADVDEQTPTPSRRPSPLGSPPTRP